jgi:micrococcal nuclease
VIRLCIIFLLTSCSCVAQLTGKVVGIADGDTFTLLTDEKEQIRVRLHGIDCPEKDQDFGQVAKKYLSDLIYNKTVSVNKMDIDRYGRTIGLVTLSGAVVNVKLLEAGLAWHYKRYDNNKEWAALEAKARELKIGLWSKPDAVAPWAYRSNRF